MKILFFSGDITRNGGTERVATIIANGLHDRGYDVSFLSMVEQAQKPVFDIDPAIKRITLSDKKTWIPPGPKALPLVGKLRRVLDEEKPDYLIDIDIVLDVLVFLADGFRKTKVISWEHLNCAFEQKYFYRKLIQKITVKKSDKIVVLTEADRLMYQDIGTRPDKLIRIYNPMTTGFMADSMVQNKIKDFSSPIILTMGRLVEVKGIDYLCEVAPQILKKNPNVKWYFVGEGPLDVALMGAARKHKLEDRLILTGAVDDVMPYYEMATLLVMASRSEALPMVLLEARSYGVPMVAFDIATGPADLIDDDINGKLIEFPNASQMIDEINKMLKDTDRLKRYSEACYNDCDKFRLDTILDQWEELVFSSSEII